MSHFAIVRSSARMAQQRAMETSQSSTTGQLYNTSERDNGNIVDEVSQMSIISMDNGEASETSSKPSRSTKNNTDIAPMLPPLDIIETLDDLEACLDNDLHQVNVIDRLDQRWNSIVANLETVLDHLQECSEQVTKASANCLQSLVDSVGNTCDKVDSEIKALYHLMTRCDELTTKLSVASSFHDEIKTLRKSVETLENLYKLRPQNPRPT